MKRNVPTRGNVMQSLVYYSTYQVGKNSETFDRLKIETPINNVREI